MAGPTTPVMTARERRIYDLAERGFNSRRIAEITRLRQNTVTGILSVIRPNIEFDQRREARVAEGSLTLLEALGAADTRAPQKPVKAPQTTRRVPPGAAELATPKEIFVAAAQAFGVEPSKAFNSGRAVNGNFWTWAATAYVLRHRREQLVDPGRIARALKRDRTTIRHALNRAEDLARFDPGFRATLEDLMARARPAEASPTHQTERRSS